MKINIDWNKLTSLSWAEDIAFEKFCFHIANRKFSEYGNFSYFYNTPGSEFYLELKCSMEYGGIKYSKGDVIGWQAKYWKGAKDSENSPLDANHIKELEDGFQTTNNYRNKIKLWIVCTPGSFVQVQWDKLLLKLQAINDACTYLSWQKDFFEAIYLENAGKYNSIFQYFFSPNFIGKDQLDSVSKETLYSLEKKFDSDIHTPSNFEQTLLSIVDNKIAGKHLREKILAISKHAEQNKKWAIHNENAWNYDILTEKLRNTYIEDLNCRYAVIEKLAVSVEKGKNLIESINDIYRILISYDNNRKERVDVMNSEIKVILADKSSKEDYSYVERGISDLIKSVNELEIPLTGTNNENSVSILGLLRLMVNKFFPVFAEAGYGKTHFACSLAKRMIERKLPVLFLMGAVFKNANSIFSKIIEVIGLPEDYTIDNALDILDFNGEIYNCRLPIIIDGLNETAPNEEIWKYDLTKLKSKIESRSNLLLITTCREKEEYIRDIYDMNDFRSVPNYIHLIGIERKNVTATISRYFKKYNIHPSNHNAHQMFNNPLLLKMFCLTNRNRKKFVLDDYSLASCLDEYSAKMVAEIIKDEGRDRRIMQIRIDKGLLKVAELIWKRNDRKLDYANDFYEVFNGSCEKLLDEGMCFMIEKDGVGHSVQFTYDMLAGYYIAKYIVETCNDESAFSRFIELNQSLFYGDKPHTLAEDITKNLIYLVPRKYGKEWFEIMPEENTVVTMIDHLDVILATERGRNALSKLLCTVIKSYKVKMRLCDNLSKRVYEQSNFYHLSMFIPLFQNMEQKELDKLWFSTFAGYQLLDNILSCLSDKYWSQEISLEDRLTTSLLLCGITDCEFRSKFMYDALLIAEKNIQLGISICKECIAVKDPFVFEGVITVITGIGLRSHDNAVVEQCIVFLENYLKTYSSNHVVLLDNLETLYSYSEDKFSIIHDRTLLYKNYDEKWPQEKLTDFPLYSIYDYDFEKYNIRPLFENSYEDKETPYDSDEIYGMLEKRINNMGFDATLYADIQKKEDDRVRYRKDLRCNYAHKYGRHALMELYGWMLLHNYIDNEYKGTFRCSIIDIDPSWPQILPMISLNSISFMPRGVENLAEWIELSDIDFLEDHIMTKLPKCDYEWILMSGHVIQQMEDRYACIDLSAYSELLPNDFDESVIQNELLSEAENHYHAFASELGWRNLEYTEGYYGNAPCITLLSRYTFSDWDNGRFKYKKFTCLNSIIAKKIGLTFDIKTMVYYLNEEIVSKYFVTESDFFFYLRRDIVNKILIAYDCKLHHHLCETRRILPNVPDSMLNIPLKYQWNCLDKFYKL